MTNQRRSSLLTRLFFAFTLCILLTGLASQPAFAAVPFTPGNIVVYRVGDGSAALSSAATAAFLDEYTPDGTLVQSIPLPTAINGANRRVTASGTATTEGFLTRSTDTKYLAVPGYDAALGTANLPGTSASAVNRVIARVDANGNLDSTTAMATAFSAGNPRGATTNDGSGFWVVGSNNGVVFIPFGATASTTISSSNTNLRGVNIFGGQLYIATAAGSAGRPVGTVGSGLPTTTGQTATTLPGLVATNSATGFFFADLNGDGFIDTLYIADDVSGQLQKYSFVNFSWTASGNIAISTARGLTGTVSAGTATLYVTNGTALLKVVDNSGFNATLTGTATQIAVAGANKAFRGVAPTPESNTPQPTNPTASGASNPSSVVAGGLSLLTVSVTAGANPTSTGITVAADLSSIGGSASQQFFDDGTHGDVAAGDNVFSFQATVAAATTGGNKSFTATINDAQGRNATAAIPLTVLAPTPIAATGSANPASVSLGGQTTLSVTVTPGTNPTSTGILVNADLSQIGGSPNQAFSNGGGGNVYSFTATVPTTTATGAKSVPVSISDAQGRTANTNISVTVNPPAPPSGSKIVISQVYGGGGNSGSTFFNDFIELFNAGTVPVQIDGWSVQATSSTGTSWTANGNPTPLSGTILPGHYYLVQESAGTGGTTPLPNPDATGALTLSGTNAKIALVVGTDPLTGSCPLGGNVLDFVGYGTANCAEGSATAALSNTTAAIRKNNGCIDTDNNRNDFVTTSGPIPRNSASLPQNCTVDPAQPYGVGTATPTSVDPTKTSLLTVTVTPASSPLSTGISVVANLSSIGGNAAQQFFDDGTNGDVTAGDGVYSYLATVLVDDTGVKSIPALVSDAQGRSASAPITLTIQSPSCGVERWTVKVGTDPDASLVDLANPVKTTITELRSLVAPAVPPDNARVDAEKKVYIINGTLTLYKLETDVDYHIVVQDAAGNTIVTEIPYSACILAANPNGTGRVLAPSPFTAGITNSRAKFDARLTAGTSFKSVTLPVQVKGVGFFDFIHGQTGVAPNGIELHPILDIGFQNPSTATLASSLNPSVYGQPLTITASVTNGGNGTPTGNVTLFDGTNQLGTVALDASGNATFFFSTLTAGTHSFTVSYEGDANSTPVTSTALVQNVTRASQTITFEPISTKTFGDADFALNASASSGLPVTFSLVSGPVTLNDSTVHIAGAGSVTIRASQAGDTNYTAAADVDQSFEIRRASQTINFGALADKTYGDAPFTISATGGASGNPVTFAADGSCTVSGDAVTITGGGSCNITASQAGDTNYDAATDVVRSFSIAKANAKIVVNGYSGVYDGAAHGATGSATGVFAEDLTSLLNLGATFTDVPGGTATYNFAGNSNYNSATGTASITISKATAAFTNLSSLSIVTGQAATSLGGTLNLGALVPTGAVSITLNGVTQNAAIGPGGAFSSSFNTSSLGPVAGGYAISYSYAGDTNFTPAAGAGSLTVDFSFAPLYDTTRAVNSGATLPIKLILRNAAGANISSSVIVVTAVQLVQVSSSASSAVQDSGNANPDGNFRFDATLAPGGGYIFNLSTKGLASGTYQLIFTAGADPKQHATMFQVR